MSSTYGTEPSELVAVIGPGICADCFQVGEEVALNFKEAGFDINSIWSFRDDATSKRITLKKGRNILRGAIINGPGMSDFCVRFINDNGTPILNYNIK